MEDRVNRKAGMFLEGIRSGGKSFAAHIHDAMAYGQAASRLHRPASETLGKYSDADLIMEMPKRGYAAMNLPADGGPPEVLR